ncbi:hypothetical protein CPC735_071480 [Coccidioides posadasii C735 delta SOWgp]|uniref:Uncharacterized protein n=1 Tax=Coccidioides posadasii (strain C735) TaxID=222929 RepID=C5P1A8_COCP7|nr:hypothetical protein CPC735_071480 [Coccidioides posadasii C735 delta SOWgp]EER29466.1 hypothetical protein CPC735_071480 [Coccidioides posadasii C735 delta SOWgp]|eukprot:XP_003071611.1 hypothetical protein CPC735_071480 [Coccidioides posadasii C735 delta SOWgp]
MGNFTKKLLWTVEVVISRPADLRKFFKPTVARGKTVWPKNPADLLRYGVRWDYDGINKHNGVDCHRYQLQPNAGKIPSTIKEWRDKNGGTHAVITVMHIPVDTEPDTEIFESSAKEALDNMK